MIFSWQQAIEKIRPYVVKITTPQGSGTGFVVSQSKKTPICAIATAAHVIDHAYYWEQPIRINHFVSGKSILLRNSDRAIQLVEENDTGAIIMGKGELPFPVAPLELIPEKSSLKVGVEMGWLGFPAVSSENLCFFSGRTSCFIKNQHAYLIDGVAINGVSGGPAFFCGMEKKEVILVGVVAAYMPNRATGDTLPGLSVIRDVAQFQKLSKEFNSIDEAKGQEVPLQSPPPPSPEAKPNQGMQPTATRRAAADA